MNLARERFFELGVGFAQFSAIPDQEKYENIHNIALSLELEFPNYNDLKNKPWWNFVPPLKWFARTNGEAFRNCYEIGMLVYLRFLLALPPNPNTRIEQINQAEEKLKNLFKLENYDLEILDDYLTSLKTDTPDEVNESLRGFVQGFPTVFPSSDEQKIRETRDKPELPLVKRTVLDPDIGEEYQITLPATDVVKDALLDFDYPPSGIRITDIAEALAEQFAITEEQREAKGKYGLVWKLHVNVAAIDLLNSEQLLRTRRGRIINPEQYSKLSPSGTESSAHPYDVFISHATEDKDEIVRPLADALIARNVRVWYDESELRMGDSVREKIEEGLANSRYGIVVLSRAFFQKKWPKYELDALVAREMADKSAILPIWHKITEDEIMAHSPGLTDKIALNTSDFTINEIAQEIAEVILNSRGPLSKKITY